LEYGPHSTLLLGDACPVIVMTSASGARGYADALDLALAMDADLVVAFADRGTGEFRLIAREPWGCMDWMGEMLDFPAQAMRPLPRPFALLAAGMMLESTVRQAQLLSVEDLPFGEMASPLDITVLGCDNLAGVIPEGVLIGAGGIGAPAVYGLYGVEALHVYDGDVAEPSNRARAVWLTEYVSKAEGLRTAFGNRVVPHTEFIAEANVAEVLQRHAGAGFCMLAVDNWDTRALVSETYMQLDPRGRPRMLVNAGCSVTGARAHTMGYRDSACLSCRRHDLEALRQQERQSCADEPQPSILLTNWIAAGMGGLLVHGALGEPPLTIPLRLTYDTANPQRLMVEPDLTCGCSGRSLDFEQHLTR
jgi:hypothetical protein